MPKATTPRKSHPPPQNRAAAPALIGRPDQHPGAVVALEPQEIGDDITMPGLDRPCQRSLTAPRFPMGIKPDGDQLFDHCLLSQLGRSDQRRRAQSEKTGAL